MTPTKAGTEITVGSPGGELLKQDSLGRVRTPREKREAIVDAFERAGMSAARFARHHGLNYSTFCSWVHSARRRRERHAPPGSAQSGGTVHWIEAVVEGGAVAPADEPRPLCVEWRCARLRIATEGQARLAAALLRELEGAGC